MQVETLGEALKAGWRVHARCVGGVVDNTRSTAKCRHQAELSLETLVWTRRRNMSLSGLRRHGGTGSDKKTPRVQEGVLPRGKDQTRSHLEGD